MDNSELSYEEYVNGRIEENLILFKEKVLELVNKYVVLEDLIDLKYINEYSTEIVFNKIYIESKISDLDKHNFKSETCMILNELEKYTKLKNEFF